MHEYTVSKDKLLGFQPERTKVVKKMQLEEQLILYDCMEIMSFSF